MRRNISAALLSLLAAAGLSWGHPDWVSHLGLDFWNLSEIERRLQREEKRRIEIEIRDANVLAQIDLKERIIDDLIAGQMTLTEAADWFRRLNADRPEYLSVLRVAHPADSEFEMYCLNVISFVETTLYEDIEVCEMVAERLRWELRAWKMDQSRDNGGV